VLILGSSGDQPDTDSTEQHRKPEGERGAGDALLQRRTDKRTGNCRDPDKRCMPDTNVAASGVERNPAECRDGNRSERCCSSLPRSERTREQQQWNDDDPATDTEEGAQQTRDKPDRYKPDGLRTRHADSLGAALTGAPRPSLEA
jgi:hypothetical protein